MLSPRCQFSLNFIFTWQFYMFRSSKDNESSKGFTIKLAQIIMIAVRLYVQINRINAKFDQKQWFNFVFHHISEWNEAAFNNRLWFPNEIDWIAITSVVWSYSYYLRRRWKKIENGGEKLKMPRTLPVIPIVFFIASPCLCTNTMKNNRISLEWY